MHARTNRFFLSPSPAEIAVSRPPPEAAEQQFRHKGGIHMTAIPPPPPQKKEIFASDTFFGLSRHYISLNQLSFSSFSDLVLYHIIKLIPLGLSGALVFRVNDL